MLRDPNSHVHASQLKIVAKTTPMSSLKSDLHNPDYQRSILGEEQQLTRIDRVDIDLTRGYDRQLDDFSRNKQVEQLGNIVALAAIDELFFIVESLQERSLGGFLWELCPVMYCRQYRSFGYITTGKDLLTFARNDSQVRFEIFSALWSPKFTRLDQFREQQQRH